MRASFRNLFYTLDIGSFVRTRHEHAMSVLKWASLLVPMSLAIGTLCAAFLWSLDVATRVRFAYPWLLFLLPLGGAVIGFLYHWTGKSVEGGNNLIVEQIHEPGGGVPLRMAPLIFIGTITTHLFGGSVGREGTAVQLGGSLASAFAKFARLDSQGVRILLMAGIAAGFGSVFGTPLAGAVFALEVLAVGRVEYGALVPCLIAGIIGDWACHAWGIQHGAYHISYVTQGGALLTKPLLLAKAAIAGVIFGLVGLAFAEANHSLGSLFKWIIPYGPARPFLAGLLVIVLVYAFGTRDYLGLGVWSPDPNAPTIARFFAQPIDNGSWLLKIIFTVVTLSAGFKGGEVTPLFYIGAALGNTLSGFFDVPTDLFAGLGFVAVFAGAANTPLACTIMGVELFGASNIVPLAIACFFSYLCSGHSGIYLSQRIAVPKSGEGFLPPETTLRDARAIRPTYQISDFFPYPQTPTHEGDPMTAKHKVSAREIGMIRIYMKPSDRLSKGTKKSFWSAKLLYRTLVSQAKAEGLMNAIAHHTHYGFSNHGPICKHDVEIGDPHLTMCVELIDHRNTLEKFVASRGELLAGKVIVYKHLEHWTLGPKGVAHEDASPEELVQDSV